VRSGARNRIEFRFDQESDEPSVETLAWDGKHALELRRHARDVEAGRIGIANGRRQVERCRCAHYFPAAYHDGRSGASRSSMAGFDGSASFLADAKTSSSPQRVSVGRKRMVSIQFLTLEAEIVMWPTSQSSTEVPTKPELQASADAGFQTEKSLGATA
jgi:hypothetical protein